MTQKVTLCHSNRNVCTSKNPHKKPTQKRTLVKNELTDRHEKIPEQQTSQTPTWETSDFQIRKCTI